MSPLAIVTPLNVKLFKVEVPFNVTLFNSDKEVVAIKPLIFVVKIFVEVEKD